MYEVYYNINRGYVMKRKFFMIVFASLILGTQMVNAQLFEYNRETIDNRRFEDVCIIHVRDIFNVGNNKITILGMTHYPLPNGETFVFLRFKWDGITYYEEHQVPGSLVWSSNKNETIYQRHQLVEARRCAIVVNSGGFVKTWFKIPDNFSIFRLADNVLCFLTGKSVNNLNMTTYKSFKCLDYNGDLVWEPNNDFMVFDFLKTDNNFYVAGEIIGDEARSLLRGYDIKTGKVIVEKIGNKGGFFLGLKDGEDRICYTEYIKNNNTNKQFSIPLETNDVASHRRKIMSSYNQNDATDQVAIGERYLEGRGFDKDEKKAFGWFQKAANQNNPIGLYQLAKCYYDGIGVNQDKAQAAVYYEKSARQHNTDALITLSDMYAVGDGVENNLSKALALKEELAFGGDIHAQSFVLSNQSVEYTKFNISADKVLSLARENYNSRNYEWAKFCYERAISLGQTDAMFEYGKWLYEGTGITKDSNKAIDYLSKLGEQNNLKAQKYLIEIYTNNKEGAPDTEQGLYWCSKAANNGDSNAQLRMADAYQYGIGVKKNKKLAFQMIERAASNGNQEAIIRIVLCYATGYGVKKDYDYCEIWAEDLSTDRLYDLAQTFEYGRGLKANKEVAIRLYEILANKKHFNAMASLAKLYISLGYYQKAEMVIGRLHSIDYSERDESMYLLGLLDESQGWIERALLKYKESRKPEAIERYNKLHAWWERNNYPYRITPNKRQSSRRVWAF